MGKQRGVEIVLDYRHCEGCGRVGGVRPPYRDPARSNLMESKRDCASSTVPFLLSKKTWLKACKQKLTLLSTNFESYSHLVTLLKVFCFSDTYFDGHKVETIFGKQGSLKLGLADPHVDRDHPPAIRHQPGYRFQLAGLLRRNRYEEPRGGSLPENNLAVELDNHF